MKLRKGVYDLVALGSEVIMLVASGVFFGWHGTVIMFFALLFIISFVSSILCAFEKDIERGRIRRSIDSYDGLVYVNNNERKKRWIVPAIRVENLTERETNHE